MEGRNAKNTCSVLIPSHFLLAPVSAPTSTKHFNSWQKWEPRDNTLNHCRWSPKQNVVRKQWRKNHPDLKRAIKKVSQHSGWFSDSVTRYLGRCPSKPEGLLMENRHTQPTPLTTPPSTYKKYTVGKEFLVLLEKICAWAKSCTVSREGQNRGNGVY